MKKTKTILALCLVTLILSSCSNKESDNTGTAAPTVQFTENIEITDAPQIEESDTTTVPTQEPTELTTEETTTTKKPKKQSSTSLKAYLNDYADSKTYHLLYDVALNKKATTNMDKDVTYMFSEDDAGNRTLGEVVAYYSDFKKIKAKNTDDFLNKYISNYFPELNSFIEKTQSEKEAGYTVKTIKFNDYDITVMSSNEMNSVTFIITESEN